MRWSRGRLERSAAASAFALALACSRSPGDAPQTGSVKPVAQETSAANSEPILPLTAKASEDSRLVKLGSRLFHDPILSSDGKVACSSCHDLANGGDDGLAHSRGVGGKLGAVNAPTVFNAALNLAQFWDGRAATLEDQVDGPVTHPLEMANDWATLERSLSANAEYEALFAAAFGAKPSRQGVKHAIAAFERTLITVDSPFDLWLRGDTQALSSEQREGYELFKAAGCVACHQGQNAGGNMYQRFGLFGDYFEDRGNVTEADNGRFNVTGLAADRHVFRVPSLRNVELTAPYFHDGSAATLPAAVKVMVKYQLGKELSEDQIGKLVEFLKSLTGPRREPVASQAGAAAR
ncbi:MAG TPA: cytochrome-c peroxidase [Polyangiaceae bacterium]|nr:cytochrome-c peroxidase [Polyangiaceae bacterium]